MQRSTLTLLCTSIQEAKGACQVLLRVYLPSTRTSTIASEQLCELGVHPTDLYLWGGVRMFSPAQTYVQAVFACRFLIAVVAMRTFSGQAFGL